jgi:glycosyltransferase 2 family protein
MLKTIILNTLKLLIAGALITWLLKSGKLDLKLMLQLKDYPLQVLGAMVLSIFNLWLITFRWNKILTARSAGPLPMTGLLQVAWIGNFFSSVLPGSVSGDLIKMLYVQKYDASLSKKFILASIFIDRLMGLSGLILLVGLTSIFFGGQISEKAPGMQPLLETNYLLAAAVIASILLFAFFHHLIRKIFVLLQPRFLTQLWVRVIILWDDLVLIKNRLFKAVLLSLVVQFGGVVVFWLLIYPFVSGQMDFIQALAFIPLGLMTLALPIAPSGLGVGHAIFQKLFEFSGISNGASLFNLYFVVTLMVNLMGAVPYLLTRSSTEAKKMS